MNTLKMKIVGWDEESKSLLVKYASDETSSADPNTYYELAYQPHTMFPEATTQEQVQTALAKAGVYVANQHKLNEDLDADTARLNMYRGLVSDTVHSYNSSDLVEDTSGHVAPLEPVDAPSEEV
mgnify:FL=1